ncbi:MAG TPA: tyrosine-type recombinase/integrase [Terracidiphilus sp.]|nr:tyrosine-type recombinase/integrase [Terracidiphilus sp.]HKF49355.1 tyrosine-type recombinase/integrase [Terracidiphilus sp.]
MDSENGHKRVNLVQYRRVGARWQFVPVVRKNGKPDPRLILIKGEPTSSRGGHFYLAWREDGKLKRQAVGSSPREALNAWHLKMGVLTGDVEPEPEPETAESKTIDAAIAEYLRDVKATKSAATYTAYRRDLAWFRNHCGKHLVSRLDRSDVMVLFAAGREEGLNQKTTNRKVVVMLHAMRGAGAEIKLRKGDWPKTADKQIEVYTPDELQKFFDACTEDQRVLFQTFLLTGFRSEEVATLIWPDIHYTTGKISVSAKPQWAFTPKSYEIRLVEVPSALLAKLKSRKKQSSSLLVFPAPKHPTRPNYGGDGVDAHLLEACKEIALRAGLNCGKCQGTCTVKRSTTKKQKLPYSCKTAPRCSRWFLHKWRHTFASNMLPVLGLKKLQLVLGHKDISTTQKYLHLVAEDEVKEKVEHSALAAFV